MGSNYDITINNLRNLVKWKKETGSHVRIVSQLMWCKLNTDESVDEFKNTIGCDVEVLSAPMNSYNEQVPNAPYSVGDNKSCVQYATHWLMISSNGDATGCCGDGGFVMSCGNFNAPDFTIQKLIDKSNEFKRNPPELCQRCINRSKT